MKNFNFNKFILIFFVFVLAFSLSACGTENSSESGEQGNDTDDKSYETIQLECSDGEKDIFGYVYVPKKNEGKLPAIICSHGYSSTYTTLLPYVLSFVEKGYVAVCFDFCGGSVSSKSDGVTTEMSIFTEESNLKAVLNTVRGLEYVDENEVYLLGASQGGMVSAMVASDLPQHVSGLILLYPAFSVAEDAKKTYSSIDDVPDTLEFMNMTIGKTYYSGLFDYDVFEDVARYEGNVLIQHGTADTIVNVSYSIRAKAAYKNATLKIYDGALHGFYGNYFTQSLDDIYSFIE